MKAEDKAKQLFDSFMINQYTNFRSERQAWKSVAIVAQNVLDELEYQFHGFLDADRITFWEQIKNIANDPQG